MKKDRIITFIINFLIFSAFFSMGVAYGHQLNVNKVVLECNEFILENYLTWLILNESDLIFNYTEEAKKQRIIYSDGYGDLKIQYKEYID